MKGGMISWPQAMGFYHAGGIVPAWRQAKKFAGSGGRIATLPDVIDARLATEPGSTPWEKYFTTSTAEYFGRSRGGNLILVVAHGLGPLANIDGIHSAYSYEYQDNTRSRRGGRITHEAFLKLADGKYGPVAVVDFATITDRYEYPFIEILRESQALEDPLLKVRLGSRATEYLQLHTRFARQWHAQQALSDPENRYNLPDWGRYLERRRQKHLQSAAANSDPFILRMEDAANCPYVCVDVDDGKAVAHLLTIGGLSHCSHEGNESLVSDVSCHEWWDGVRLVGVRTQQAVSNIHPGVESVRLLISRNWRSLMRPSSGPAQVGFRALTRVDDEQWFTQTQKRGDAMDSYEPEFRVSAIEAVGEPIEFVTPITGYHGFFRYEIRDVKKIAPRGANAYSRVGEVEIVWRRGNPEFHKTLVQFYRVQVDSSQRLVREDELQNDDDALSELLAREEG